ncbi:hypothetical protein KC19_12G176100 [Ceratodon purpureus]|uniref:Uncharacterized protein n=2 Tax=Ceratodon purpureus TaxID=3225 RepID=A0A8T0G9Y2_CERPU|nr:hypothetical protein KC19_12G176100 [Ceratodon purpureus]
MRGKRYRCIHHLRIQSRDSLPSVWKNFLKYCQYRLNSTNLKFFVCAAQTFSKIAFMITDTGGILSIPSASATKQTMAPANGVSREDDKRLRLRTVSITLIAFTWLCSSSFAGVDAQLLHPTDMMALRAIKNSMGDLPGGTFFSTWVFAFRINPCLSFAGLQCTRIGSFNRISALSLGPTSSGTPGLTGTLPTSLGDMIYLQTLTISAGAIRGPIPDTIGNLKKLTTFSCSSNYISGQIPPSLANLQSLEALQIWKNQLTGEIPAGIGTIKTLKVLIMSDNHLYGPIPSFAQTSLIHFDVRNNYLSGGLPELPISVQYLSVTQNQLSGSIDSLTGLVGLSYLDLSLNGFSGSIPSAVFGFPLTFLLLSHNQFRGAVNVPGLVTIPVVDLSHNHLQGSISPYLAGSQSLFLNNNLFVGTVPQAFANKMQDSTLQSLYLQHNYLTDSGALASAPLPPSVAVCLLYNCMEPPAQSLCPPNVAMPAVRPGYQCLKADAAAGSPGDRKK